jgi:hypothetical protein
MPPVDRVLDNVTTFQPELGNSAIFALIPVVRHHVHP